MKPLYKILGISVMFIFLAAQLGQAQISIRGKVQDADTGEELIGAAVALVDLGGGTITNYAGEFLLQVEALPVKIRVAYTGYTTQELDIISADDRVLVRLAPNSIIIEETVVRGQRISEKQKAAPLSVETMDAIAIKETPAVSFYNGLGNLKGVDLTTASLGFTIINTRGFNSTSPVRSLQIIDGVDNQAPGLNFSLGNFLGASELDVLGVELISGAAGPFYGPNAFNGVISIKSKDPFIQKGLSASLKGGERDLFEAAIRWADAAKNKSGNDFFAYKLNFFFLRAYDWVADNYEPVYETEAGQYYTPLENPGRYDAVNRYGDGYQPRFDLTGESPWNAFYGMQQFHRTGYNEVDLVDYDTRNIKANAAFHFRLNPERDFESPELILSSSFGSGTTVYQGENRFSLRDILFFQNRLELRQKDKFFLRFYATNEDAGKSYDPYFTALQLQRVAKDDLAWASDYSFFWSNIGRYTTTKRMKELGYPQLIVNPNPPYDASFDDAAAAQWFMDFRDTLAIWHQKAMDYANSKNGDNTSDYFQPGTPEFDQAFNQIVGSKSGALSLNGIDGLGTLFYDKSSLYHGHGEYRFTPKWASFIVVGANTRFYRPRSEGTIFSDTLEHVLDANGVVVDSSYKRITNWEMGYYTGIEKKLMNDKFILTGTIRADKNENFDWLFTPAASLVYTPNATNYLRVSFSSAIRNPTLTDQYLKLNVGPATLLGNLNGFEDLITVESLREALDDPSGIDVSKLVYLDIDPIRPEKVKAFELGYRTTLWNKLYVDAGYYYNIYDDFIGYNLGLTAKVTGPFIDLNSLEVYRVSANSINQVTTQGFNIGLNYYFSTFFQWSGNYSWNKLNKLDVDDPIIPAFNTPEHKFNLGLSARDLPIGRLKRTGFNITYKWIQGFIFEGSPQFTGFIPTYDMVDAQWNCTFDKINTTFKIGATNLFGIAPLFRSEAENGGRSKLDAMFHNAQFQTYGGPRIGRMAYVSILYNFEKR